MICQSYDIQGQKATKAGRASKLRQTCFRSGARFSSAKHRSWPIASSKRGSRFRPVSFHFRQFFRSLLPPARLHLGHSRFSLGASQLRHTQPSRQPRKNTSQTTRSIIADLFSSQPLNAVCGLPSCHTAFLQDVSTYAGPVMRHGHAKFEWEVSKYIRRQLSPGLLGRTISVFVSCIEKASFAI